jgi:hypothetical protein
MLWALRIEDGRMWGEVATDDQKIDAEAILTNKRPDPTWHFLTRPRGGSKSTDVAGMGISWLVQDAPPLANGHVVAASTDQAAIIIDAAAGFLARTPELEGAIIVESEKILGPSGAWIEVLAQSDAGAWGLRDAHFLVCDEFCQWPTTRGAKRVFAAIQSAAPKVTGAKFIIMSSAGEPSHWSREVFEKCQLDPMWRVHEMPGPVPWLSPDELKSLEWHLSPSQYERLVLNKWSEDEDRAVSEEDWDAAAQSYKSLRPRDKIKYIMLVDIGITNDASVMTVMHKEPIEPNSTKAPFRVVVDHIERWKGSKKKPVQVSAVEDWIVENAPMWNKAPVYADPTQFRGSIQNLNRRGVRAKEWAFTATSVGEVATALVQTFRNRQIFVPNLPILKDELLRVRLRESSPGVTRLDHERGAHDDQAVTIGMGCRILLGGNGGVGANFKEFMARDAEKRLVRATEEGQTVEAKTRMERQMNSRREAEHNRRERAAKTCAHRWSPDRSHCMFCNSPAPALVEVS